MLDRLVTGSSVGLCRQCSDAGNAGFVHLLMPQLPFIQSSVLSSQQSNGINALTVISFLGRGVVTLTWCSEFQHQNFCTRHEAAFSSKVTWCVLGAVEMWVGATVLVWFASTLKVFKHNFTSYLMLITVKYNTLRKKRSASGNTKTISITYLMFSTWIHGLKSRLLNCSSHFRN